VIRRIAICGFVVALVSAVSALGVWEWVGGAAYLLVYASAAGVLGLFVWVCLGLLHKSGATHSKFRERRRRRLVTNPRKPAQRPPPPMSKNR